MRSSVYEMVSAVNGTSEVLCEKDFDVFAVVIEQGAFITQRRNKRVGKVRARSIQEAQALVAQLYSDMSGAYPAPSEYA